jgi:hypothetical protein
MIGATAVALALSIGGTFVAGEVVHAAPGVATAPMVLAGQFCKQVDLGKVVTADNGKTVKCVHKDGYNRWIVK